MSLNKNKIYQNNNLLVQLKFMINFKILYKDCAPNLINYSELTN